MKDVLIRVRTPSAILNWLDFAAQVNPYAQSLQMRMNGKQRKADGFYSSLQCQVVDERVCDLLTEVLAFVERRPTTSFEVNVNEPRPSSSQLQPNTEPLLSSEKEAQS